MLECDSVSIGQFTVIIGSLVLFKLQFAQANKCN